MYDLAIIGAGAAGIACAKNALKFRMKVLLVDKEQSLFGGICLNKGCIPTKFIINSAKLHKTWQESLEGKEKLIENIKLPLLHYLESQGVEIVWGEASFVDANIIDISGKQLKAKNVIIATGSSSRRLLDHPKLILAEDIFSQSKLGNKILIVGAGYIGVELASLLKSMGKEIHLIDIAENILPNFDSYLSKRLRIILEKQGIDIQTEKSVYDCNLDDFDVIISAVGREPNIKNLKIENLGFIGLSLNELGWVKTDKTMKTNIENIYACGDITGKKLLAYVAEYQARLCVDNIKQIRNEEDYYGLPECVFSTPQMAKVGLLTDEARRKNVKHRVIRSNFLKFSSAYVHGDTEGFIEIVFDEKERIIGAGVISNLASELISIFTLCVKNNLKLKDLKKCLLIHPTLSEIAPLLLNLY